MAKQIRTFGMSSMTVGACANFHVTTLKYITVTTPEILHIESKIEAYRAKVNLLDSLVNRKRAYRTTPEMRAVDKIRDRAIGTINGGINTFRHSPVEEKRKLAERLAQDLSSYQGIGVHEYNKQTSEVRGMLRVLELEENKAAIARFGLTEEVDVLRESNDEFVSMFDERVLEVSDIKEQGDIDSKELMRETNELYMDIVQTVNAYAIVQPSEEIDEFITKMNGLVGSLADASGSSSSSKNPDTEDPEEEEENPTTEPEEPTTGEGEEEEGTGAIPHP